MPDAASAEQESGEPAEAPSEEEAGESAGTLAAEETETSSDDEAGEPAVAPVKEADEGADDVSVEEVADGPVDAPAGEAGEATAEALESQENSGEVVPQKFVAPGSVVLQQADEGNADGQEKPEIAAPALEISNVAATMAVPEVKAAQANTSTDEAAAPQTEDRTVPLQQLIKDKIASVSTLSGVVQIVLAKDTTFEGDVEIKKSDKQTVSDDFELQLVAEDALDESGKVIEGGGSGQTVVSGDLKISGMNVLMRGVMVALGKKVTVSDARLTYEGTGRPDTLEVELASNGSAQIHTYEGEDKVSVTLYDGARNAEVNTGDEGDNISVTAYDGAVSIETGSGGDTVSLDLQSGAGAVNADTGAGSDRVKAKIASSGAAIKTGDGADTVEIDAQYGSDNIHVETGEGADRVSVKKSDELYSSDPTGTMSIDLGGGASRLDVDLSVGKGYAAIETRADRASGSRLNLTGKLDESTGEDKRIEWASGAKEAIVLHPANGKALIIGVRDFASLTDALEKKRTKNVSTAGGVFEDFTNYILDNATDKGGVKSWSGDATASAGLTLSNLVLGKPEEPVNVGDVDATGFNLLIRGNKIDLTGTIKAKNIAVLAKDEHDISLHLDSDSIMGKVKDLFKWIGDNFHQNVVSKALVNVTGTARLYAVNDIDLTAQLKQSGGLLESDLISMIVNPVNVKVGTAQVNIASGAEMNAKVGSFTAGAKVTTDMTAGKAAVNLPVAVNVAVQNASVLVEKDAVLEAARNIDLSADSSIKADAEASSMAATTSVPLAVSVGVLLNNVTVDVKGKLTAGKDANVSALGEITGTTSAKHDGDSVSGVYLGTHVALQNVRALVGKDAVVNAGSDVNVKSTADLKAVTAARSGMPDEKKPEASGFEKTKELGIGMAKEYIGGFLGGVWDKIKNGVVGFFKNDPSDFEKMDRLLSSVAGGEYTVKLAEDSEQKGDVKFTERSGGKGTDVKITPWEGHQVDKVYYVYLDNPDGDDAAVKYTVKEAVDGSDAEENLYYIPHINANVRVYVTYKDGEYAADDVDTWTPDDLFNENDDNYGEDLQSLFDDATAGAQNTDDDYGEDLQRLFDEGDDSEEDAGDKLKFAIEPTETRDDKDKTAGSILNARFSLKNGAGAATVEKNGKVAFVVNAKSGYQLKDDGLIVTYYKSGEDKEQKAVLKDDGNGRYIFTVPGDILTDKYDGGIAFKVISEFEKKDEESDDKVDQTQTQVNGSVAVTVALNDNRAEIQSGASVTARDTVNVIANEETRVNTNTDGTGVAKNQEKKEDRKKKQEEQQKLLSGQYIVTGREVSLTLDAISGGTVDVKQNGAYGYIFTPRQNGVSVKGASATLRFMKDGKWQTKTLTANSDGTFNFNLTDYAIDKGTQAVLSFAMSGGSSSEKQEKRDLVDYTMNVSYNVYQLSKEEDPYNVGSRKIGNVYYVRTTGTGSNARYYFNIQADWANGYTVDAVDAKRAGRSNTSALWAAYTDGSGKERKVALRRDKDSSYWYVQASDLTGIAQGGKVTVNVRFTEDKHDVLVPRDSTKNGKLTFSESKAKATDVITIKATPDANYGAGKITVRYTKKNSGTTETVELTPDENGEAKFTMPVLADAASLYVSAVFNEKTVTLQKDARSRDVSINTAGKVSAGEKIAVSLTNDAVKAGKKLNDTAQVTYTPKEGQRKTVQVAVKNGKLTLPDDIADSTDVSIAVNAVEKTITLDGGEAKLEHGTLKIASSKADKGEKVVVTIAPEAGYRFKQGSGTVEIATSTSTYKVKLTRKDDGTLTFTMPTSMTSAEVQEAKVSLTLKGEFEKGSPDSDTYQTSVGAAASVSVVNANNDAAVSGGTVSGKTVKVNATTVGDSKTSASAGYSKAVTGLAGGFGVQVASFDTNALVKKDATLNAGTLSVTAKGTHGLETTGSAAGAKDAGSTGVGSGIAVNVSSADVTAAIQDGANIAVKNGKLTVAATGKTNDKVTARAGAKGDKGITPVIGVDVFGSSASAYLGKVRSTLTARTLQVTGTNTAVHSMAADASTGGGSVALGGAFAVTVIHDEALARLNKNVTNGAADSAVTISAAENTTQSVTATAGVTGGVKGKAGKNGSAGSADRQTDSILSGAGNIAAGKRSNSLSLKGSGSADRQKAQTSEGSVGGAAAVAVNVLSSSAVARVMDDSNIQIGGALAVKSLNRTETKLKANGSTARTDTGVGVAVAVNVVDIENVAEIGTGAVRAATLEVSALMPAKANNAVAQMTTVKMPANKDAMASQMAEYIRDGINDALSSLGVDQSVIGELAADFSKTFVEYVLKETGLNQLLGDGTFDEKADKVLNGLNGLWDSVKAYPTVLLEPLTTLKDEITALRDVDVGHVKDILLGELKGQLPNLLKNTAMAVLNRAKDDIGALALEAVNNKLKGKDQSSTKEKAKETLKNAVKAEWDKLTGELMGDALTRLRSEVPALTEQNIDTIKSAFTTSMDQKKDFFVNYFTDTFQSKVFNYSAVMDKISNTDLASEARKLMRNALNASVAKVGDKAIEALVKNLDVQLKSEDVSNKHVIRTEAIAGAAAKDVGIAGSVAITVLNANTRATVNSGSGTATIAGDANVQAREARRVTTTASAALDEKGNADTNKDAGKKSEKDTAGSNATPTIHLGTQLEVKSAAGAELAQDASDKDIVWITPRDGWKIAAGADKATWTYTDDEGEEKTGKLQVYSRTEGGETKYYVKASEATTATGKLTTITVTPEEDLHTISGLDAINMSEDGSTRGKVPDGAVSVTVDGRDEAVKDGKLSAKTTDTVKIAIDKTRLSGLMVDSIDYITADGKIHAVPLSATENGGEIVFTFAMPAQNVTGILVTVDKAGEGSSDASKTAATDSRGRSVGVGASFAMVYGDSSVTAGIGRNVNAGGLAVDAGSDHVENTASVSGTDALTGKLDIDAMKKTSVDASVALDILDNAVNATLSGTAKTTRGDLALTASENAVSETRASGYAVGSQTAVGAAVAVNIASSAVDVQARKDLTSAGSAKLDAGSHSEDVTKALATAMGADIARAMNKVGETANNLKDKTNDLLKGKLFDGKTDGGSNKDNKTADRINARMDKKKAEDGESSSKNLSLSSNALRNQNVTTNGEDAGSEGTDEAASQIAQNTDHTINSVGRDTKSKVQVAAAVGVTVASHDASVKVGKVTADKAISAVAENSGNFNTMGTGAAMSLAEKANSIALGVAVSVNNNRARVESDGDLVARNGDDVTLSSKLTQNMDGAFPGKLAVQALSGSVAGKDSSISLGGAVSVLVSRGESSVNVTNASSNAHRSIRGGNVTIEAIDKSRLTARAGGISLSRGSSVGMGIASANVISGNAVAARVGNFADIIAGSFRLNAEKQAVTDEDYKSNIDMRYLITDSSKLSEEQRKEANTGLIDVHKGKKDNSYTVDIHLSGDKLLSAVDGLNFLSAQNTYVEAIAGSIATGKTKASLAGSLAVAETGNEVEASLGNGAHVVLTRKGEQDGSMAVNAGNGATTRVIAGSVSAAPARTSVGATVAVLLDGDQVTSSIGSTTEAKTVIEAEGDFTQNAATTGNIQLFTGAMSVAAGMGDSDASAVGGAVNVIVTKNETRSSIGNNATITSGSSAKVASGTTLDLMAISGSANVSAAAGSSVAAGGTVNVIVDKSTAETTLGNSNSMKAAKDVSVTSDVSDQLISGTASISAAASGSGNSGAGAVNVIVSKSRANTAAGMNADLEATSGDLKIDANNDAWMLNAGVAASGGGKLAIGGAINVNVFDRTASVSLASGSLNAGRNLVTQASGRDTDIMAGLSLAAGATGAGVSGNVAVAVMNSRIQNTVSSGVTATAGGSAVMESYYSGFDVAGAGNLAASGTKPAVGVAAVIVVRDNDVKTQLAASTVNAWGDAALRNLSGREVSGVYVGANAGEHQYVAAAGVAATGSSSVNGTVTVLVNKNKVTADASQATLKADAANTGVEANDDTHQLLLAGGVSISGGTGVGAAVTTLVSDKEIQAVALNMDAGRDAGVQATNRDDIIQLSVSAGISNGVDVQIGAAVQVLKSRVAAHVGAIDDDGMTKTVTSGTVNARNGAFRLKAQNDAALDNVAVTAAAGTGTSVVPVGVVTYFQGEADARIRERTAVTAAKDIEITATGDKNIDMISVGAAAGKIGISGTANVLVSKEKTRAITESGTSLTANAGGIDIDAINGYKLRSVSGAIAAGSIGVAVNAVVSVLKSNVTAELGGTASALKNLNVKADSSRDVLDVVGTAGLGGVGVGVTAMVLVAGTKMSQDAADMVAYGNASSKSRENATFDAATFMDNAEKNGIASKHYTDENETDADRRLDGAILAEDISGNGHRESENSVGTTTTKDGKRTGTFDGSSGYMDKDMDYLSDYSEAGKGRGFSNNTQQGANLKAEDTEDVKKAKELNTYVYDGEPSDEVVARIATTGSVTRAEGVSVTADQRVSADLFGATLSAGAVGVGISAAVAVLHSNVTATSLGSIRNVGSRGIEINASSRSGDVIKDDAKERDDALEKALGDAVRELDPKNHAIRAIGVAVGAGAVGVAVSVSVVLTDNVTQAILGGKVDTNGDTRVLATHNYGNVMAATLSVAAGGVAAGASVSVAQANGTVRAEVNKGAGSNGKLETRNLSIRTDSNVNVNALAATAGAGAVSINAGVALAFNRLKQSAGIRGGADVTTLDDLTLSSTSRTTADSSLLGVSFGGVGAALGAAVSDLDASIDTAIEKANVNVGGKLKVQNDVSSSATPKVLSIAAGAAGIAGNVLLAFNDSEAKARIDDSTVASGDLDVISDLGSTARSSLASLAVGGLAIGISVNYADLHAVNEAAVRGGTVSVRGDMNVRTGVGSNNATRAIAETISGEAGLLAVGLNVAIARNNSRNIATLTDIQRLKVDKALTVHASGSASTDASLTGLNVDAVSVQAAVVVSLNDADNRTLAGIHNAEVNGKSTFNATQNASTDANITTGGGSLVGLKANVAAAYGRARSIVDVTLDNAVGLHGITALNNASDDTNAIIRNQDFSMLSAQAMVGLAYSQDQFNTSVKLKGNNTVDGDVNINTNYLVTGKADITPSTMGIDASLAKVALNIGLARNTADAGAALKSEGGRSTISGSVNVYTDGAASTDATIHSAEFSINAVGIGANLVNADLAATQASRIALDNSTLHIAGNADVQSRASHTHLLMRWRLKRWKDRGRPELAKVNIDKLDDTAVESLYKACSGTDTSTALSATALMGASGGEGIQVSLINVNVNISKARENMRSTAAIVGGNAASNILNVDGSMNVFSGVKEGVKTASLSRTDGAKEIAIASIGKLDGRASSNDSFKVELKKVDVNVGGRAELKARTDTSAYGYGTTAGGFKMLDLNASDIKAGIGTKDAKETARILLDDNVKLTADTVDMQALNQGTTEAFYKQGTTVSVLKVGVSSMPTESYYDTGVSIGKGAVVTASKDTQADECALNIASETRTQAKSEVAAKQISIGFDLEIMEGLNTIGDDNIIDIGEGARLQSAGSMNISTLNNTKATATTDLMGIGAFFAGKFSGATNTIDRVGRINIRDGANLTTANGTMNLSTVSGTADDIYTYANADSGGMIAVGEARVTTDLRSENAILIGDGVNMISARDMNLFARSTSHKADGSEGVVNKSNVEVGGLEANIDSRANANLLFATAVHINRGGTKTTQLQTSQTGSNIDIRVDNEGLRASDEARGVGGAGYGHATSEASLQARLQNNIWVDEANLFSEGTVNLLATNSTTEAGKPKLSATSYAKMMAALGTVKSHARVHGDAHNQIRSNNTDKVHTKGKFEHTAVKPVDAIQNATVSATYDRLFVTTKEDVLAAMNLTAMKRRCDFCAGDEGEDVTPEPLKGLYPTDREKTMKMAQEPVKASAPGQKALASVSDIQRMSSGPDEVSKARYGEENDQVTARIYRLDVKTLLNRDVTFDADQMKKYRLWTNVMTQHDVYLLPNATRLYRNVKLDYVSEVMSGDAYGNGTSCFIDIFTALNTDAAANPTIPIGSSGSLDLSTGIFTLPELADFELYLHEVSGAWLLEQLYTGSFSRMDTDPALATDYVLMGGPNLTQTLPAGAIIKGMTEADEADGWRKYWLGDTPETAKDDDQVLVYLMWNRETDEVDAFRTSLRMIEAGAADIDVSLYIFRDSKTDRRGEEKYNILFYDTPEGEKSLVKVITDVLEERKLELPRPIRIVLRGFDIAGADFPIYSLTDRFFAMCDGTDGKVSMFEGNYQSAFDGDTFESDYTKIEGILSDDLKITLKKDQFIWPEQTGENIATDH